MDFNRLVQIDLAYEDSSFWSISTRPRSSSARNAPRRIASEKPLGDGALQLDSARTKGVRFIVLEKGCAHFSS